MSRVPDPRDPRGVRYPLTGLLTVAVCADLAGASSFAAITDWLHDLDDQARDQLGFGDQMPVGTTVWRLLTRLDDALLSTVLADWLRTRVRPVESRPHRHRTVIAVDGKALRGARCGQGGRVHLLSALDANTGIILAQVTIAAKSNEIPAFAPLLDAVEQVMGSLTGLLFIADALHTQTAHAQEIAARGAHLMIPAKGNQPILYTPAQALPWPDVPAGGRRRDRGHGRRETRTVKAITLRTPGGIRLPQAEQAVGIIRTRTTGGRTSRETAYFTVSLPAEHAQPTDLQDWARRERSLSAPLDVGERGGGTWRRPVGLSSFTPRKPPPEVDNQ
ncbi:ISAs1 family transposase [Micromonospora ureilytica]|uniref:ISAs1 family transposase n=1 Tax=Micromonospora ureilytica TaxID=709868 RepID=UPI0040399BF9